MISSSKNIFKKYWYIFVLYLFLGFYLAPLLWHYIDGIDMLNYISIAHKYQRGEFYDAINDYWSPLIPWLLTPLLYTGADAFLLFKILQVIIGFIPLYICISFLEKTNFPLLIKVFAGLVFALLILSFGLLYGSPDLLFVSLLLIYFSYTTTNYISSKNGTKAGITGGILFLAKAYGFPFFILHFCCINCYYWFTNKSKEARNTLYNNALKGFTFFFIISGIWIACLSSKNKSFTISGSGKYNFSLIGPEYSLKEECYLCHPAHERGLFLPANKTAVNITEEPSKFEMHRWSPFTSLQNFKHWLIFIKTNLLSFYYFDVQLQYGTVCLLIFIIYLIAYKKRTQLPSNILLMASSALLYTLCYSLVIINPRYIWINTFTFSFATFYLISAIAQKEKNKFIIICFALPLLALLVKRPIKELMYLKDKDVTIGKLSSDIMHIKSTIENTMQENNNLFTVIDSLKKRPDLQGIWVNEQQKGRENYLTTALLCYYTNNKHYGELTSKIINKEGYQQLNIYHVNFYLIWDNAIDTLPIESKLAFVDKKSGLKIFKVEK